MTDYLLAFGSVLLLALNFIIQKLYQKSTDSTTKSSSIFSVLSSVFSIVYLIVMNGFAFKITAYSVINATLKAICGLAYTIIGFKIMREGSVAYYMMFLMTGGMLLPAIYGWLFLSESIKLLHLLGVFIIIFAIVLSNLGESRPKPKVILMCSGVFLLNGCVSILSKLHQTCTEYNAVSTTGYAIIGTVASLITSLGLLIFACAREKNNRKNIENVNNCSQNSRFNYKALLLVAVYGIIGVFSSLMQLESAKNLPASMLYPIITGGTVGLTGLFAALFFKEKLSKRGLFGVILCIVGTVLFI